MKRISLLIILFSVSFTEFISALQQTYQLGLRFNDLEYHKIPKRFYFVGNGRRQEAHSLKQYCPKPLSQLDLTTSAGWATGYAAFTITRAIQHNWPKGEITEKASSPIYPYYKAKKVPDLGSLEVVSLVSVLEALKMYGTPDYLGLPSRSIDYVSEQEELDASTKKISEYTRLYNIQDPKSTKIDAIKATISEGMPVVAAMHIPKSFFYAKEFWLPREIFSEDMPGHAVTIIGYDDNKYGGAFEIMNSWGTEWGNNGFMWIRYDDFIEFSEYALNLYVIPGFNSSSELAGSVDLAQVAGKFPMEVKELSAGYYKIVNSYPSGTIFTVNINNSVPAFVYAFATDLTGEIFPFFPAASTSAAINQAASFYVPDQNTPIEVDETIGTDFLCILFSKEPLNINYIFNNINQISGDFRTRLQGALNKQLIAPSEIQFEPDQVKFKMPYSKQSVVAIIIEHDHQ